MSQTFDVEQRSDAWRQLRLGRVTASRIGDILAKTKSGYSASRANLMAELICERLTGKPNEGFVSAPMQHGIDTEPEARSAYEFYKGLTVKQIGFALHPRIEQAGCSPDGLINDDGLIEIKCPQGAAHLETLLAQKIPEKYIAQMQMQMACTERQWVDFVSYCPSFPEELRLYVCRLFRDDKRISELETEVAGFLLEMAVKLSQLTSLYGEKEAA